MTIRRTLLKASLALLAAPPSAFAQAPARTLRIGLLGGSSRTSPESGHVWQAFVDGMRDLGYVEGRNIVIDGRYYGDRVEQLPVLAAELVRLELDVIVAAAPPAPEAARRATSTIPIVMANHADPVASGLVASLGRPGGNVTGLSLQARELRVKQLQLLKEILPRLTRVAFLRNPGIPLDMNELNGAARSLNLQVQMVEAQSPNELPGAIQAAARERSGALMILAGSMFFAHRVRIASLALENRLPTCFLLTDNVDAGGLLAYGPDLRANFRQAAGYVDRILRGAKPGELPIEQPTKFELAVNLKTAKALGVTIPPSVLARADRVVE